MVQIIGAPFDLCGLRLGSRLGPAAIRLAGLVDALRDLGIESRDNGDVMVNLVPDDAPGLKNFGPLMYCARTLNMAVADYLVMGDIPIVLGGDHTLASAGVAAAVRQYGDELAVLWIDAHADVNTPGSSETGNVHGMPLAALWGLPSEAEAPADAQWEELKDLSRPTYLAPAQTAWFGLRDVDAAERSRLNGLPISMHDVDRYGVAAMMDRFHQWLADREITHLWVSFDVDSLDPVYAPGTGTTVRGGLSYREAHLLAELLHEGLQNGGHQLAGVDIVEVNPLVDRNNETAEVAVEWVASLFGKAIL
jgi:arginase